MANSKQIGALVGPALVAMLASEFPLVQPHLYDAQIPPVVYLSGVLMFVAGLAVVRAHNLWVRDWRVLVTLTGWFFLGPGLIRMFAASQYKAAAQSAGLHRIHGPGGMPASDCARHHVQVVPGQGRMNSRGKTRMQPGGLKGPLFPPTIYPDTSRRR